MSVTVTRTNALQTLTVLIPMVHSLANASPVLQAKIHIRNAQVSHYEKMSFFLKVELINN